MTILQINIDREAEKSMFGFGQHGAEAQERQSYCFSVMLKMVASPTMNLNGNLSDCGGLAKAGRCGPTRKVPDGSIAVSRSRRILPRRSVGVIGSNESLRSVADRAL
jgi:hypothetical protein